MSMHQVQMNPNRRTAPVAPETVPSRIDEKRPLYRALEPYYDKYDQRIDVGVCFYHEDEPNQFMQPLNKIAYDKWKNAMELLNMMGADVAKGTNKIHTPIAIPEWSKEGTYDIPLADSIMGVKKVVPKNVFA